LILFVIAVGVDELDRRSAPAAWIGAALLLAVVVPMGIAGAIEPRSDSDLRGALTVVNRGFEPGDAVAVIPLSGFAYYRDVVEEEDVPVFRLTRHTRARSVIEFAQQNGARRLWIVAAHAVRHTRKLREELAEAFPVLSQWRTNGTVVMLLDFSKR
jgi:hypothetical protein